MNQWHDAHVGTETEQVAFRLTQEEKQRLEELRQAYRLTSKAQVLRLALDALQVLGAPGSLLLGMDYNEVRARGDRVHDAATNHAAVQRFIKERTSDSGGAVACPRPAAPEPTGENA